MTEADISIEMPEENPKGPSTHLTAARERLGFSQKDVADKLYLTTTFIKYIDDGEFAKIPKPAFIRGYLRSYARVVELSGDDVVAMYEEELAAGEPALEMKGVTDEKVGTASITGPVLQTGLIGFIGLLLVIAGIWWLVSDSDNPDSYPTVTQPDLPGPVVSTEEADAAFEYVLEGETGDDGFVTSVDISADNEESVVDEISLLATDGVQVEQADRGAPAVIPDNVKVERVVQGERNYITLDAGGFDQIEFTFAEECWIEIDDGQYGLIYNDLNRENDVLTLYGTLPFEILLGKATGVEMIYNGRPFDLEPYTSQDDTAKLTISD